MKNFTERQLWDVLRRCVGDNNTTLRKIFSSSVSAQYNYLKDKYPNDRFYYERQKSYAISSGIRNIYKAFTEKFFEYDYDGEQDAASFTFRKEVWLDNISTKDLYYYYSLQKSVLNRIENLSRVSEDSIIYQIENAEHEYIFDGKVSFSGKPEKTKEDRETKIDVNNVTTQQEVLTFVALREYEKFCAKKHIDFEKTKESFLKERDLEIFETEGCVAKTYFQEKENAQKDENLQQKQRPKLEECSPEESAAFEEALRRSQGQNNFFVTTPQENNGDVEESSNETGAQSHTGQPEQLTIFDILNKYQEQ